ncbi:MAG TPA: FAD-binding protein [Fimbriimonadaceae bacterium]|nr:FAD-binding protein [Fimbriimonadaceae bacterium]
MSKLLCVAFLGHETESLAAFGHALGMPYDMLSIDGKADLNVGAGTQFNANLSELPLADSLCADMKNLLGGYTHIAAISSMASKDVMARLAGLIDAAMVTDVIQVISPTQFKRPIAAGSIFATVETLAEPVVLTVRPAGFPKEFPRNLATVQNVEFNAPSKGKRIGANVRGGARPDLSQAKVVVSGGRPLKDAATFESVIGGLADALGGAVGATRAAVDSGIAPNELQVGQTGKIVAPDLYIAAGISGSTQHMAGIKDSKTIVAINKDPDAPIFEAADLGLVADLYEAIPEFRAEIGK